jgi:hypothetical protein
MEGVHKNDADVLQGLCTEEEKQSLIMILKEVIESEEVRSQYENVVEKI